MQNPDTELALSSTPSDPDRDLGGQPHPDPEATRPPDPPEAKVEIR